MDNNVMFAEERKAEILNMLKKTSKIYSHELCEKFGVSPATIRSDLRDLDEAGLLQRTHGGAISVDRNLFERASDKKKDSYAEQKRAIALSALELIDDGDAIALDTGTTTLELAKLLGGARHRLNVVTNDIEIAQILESVPDISVMLTGGTVRHNMHCTVGPVTVNTIKGFSVDKLFLATNAISLTRGLATPDPGQAEVKRTMIDISAKVYLLADSSKIGRSSFSFFAPLSKVTALVTDSGITREAEDTLSEAGVSVIKGNK